VSDLAAVVGVGGSGGVRLVDRLATQGLVTRTPSPTDRRTVLLRLTEAGTQTARRVLHAREEAVRQTVEALDEDQRSALEQLLPALVTALPSTRTEVLRTCRLCDVAACRQASGCPLDCWPPDDRGPS
jgi:DNA-binding MarR family transcriptional regulator